MKLRHFRDNQELPWVKNDENYDFEYQQTRPLPDEIKVLRGDHLTTGMFCQLRSAYDLGLSVCYEYSQMVLKLANYFYRYLQSSHFVSNIRMHL